MKDIKYQMIKPDDYKNIELIAAWYFSQWNIPLQTTIDKIRTLSIDKKEFQILMTLNNKPIATGGLYTHVSLLDKEPRFTNYKNWLGLLYTTPECRGQGYGAFICKHIQTQSKEIGIQEIYLFTHTAESLYKRIGWKQVERLSLSGKDIVVMKKEL